MTISQRAALAAQWTRACRDSIMACRGLLNDPKTVVLHVETLRCDEDDEGELTAPYDCGRVVAVKLNGEVILDVGFVSAAEYDAVLVVVRKVLEQHRVVTYDGTLELLLDVGLKDRSTAGPLQEAGEDAWAWLKATGKPGLVSLAGLYAPLYGEGRWWWGRPGSREVRWEWSECSLWEACAAARVPLDDVYKNSPEGQALAGARLLREIALLPDDFQRTGKQVPESWLTVPDGRVDLGQLSW